MVVEPEEAVVSKVIVHVVDQHVEGDTPVQLVCVRCCPCATVDERIDEFRVFKVDDTPDDRTSARNLSFRFSSPGGA